MNRRSTSTALTLLSLIFAVSISSRARSAQVGELEKLNVCYSSIAATSITTWVPHEAGIYKKYGLDVSIIYVAGAQAITTLVSGDTQIVQGSGAAAALSRLSGSDATVIGTTINVKVAGLASFYNENVNLSLDGVLQERPRNRSS